MLVRDTSPNKMAIEIHLCTLDSTMARAWSSQFGSQPNVWIHEGDILANKADAILSPANSFGFMDGGIDLAYSNFFGWDLQDRLQETLRREHAGELPVGGAVVTPTPHASIPFSYQCPDPCVFRTTFKRGSKTFLYIESIQVLGVATMLLAGAAIYLIAQYA